VLLKNAGGILPLDAAKVHSIAVIGAQRSGGPNGRRRQLDGQPQLRVTPLDGLRERAGSEVRITYALGVSMQASLSPTILRPPRRS